MATHVLPSFDAGEWDHLNTIQNDLFMQGLVDPARIASPTHTIMWNGMQYYKLNADGTYILPIDLSVNPSIYATGVHIIYDTQHSEETTRASYRPALAYNGNAISELQIAEGGEFNDNAVLVPELMTRQRACNKGLTYHMMYEIWAKQNYTTVGGEAAEPTGSTINISDIMQNVYLNAQIKNKPSSVVNRFTSLPSIIKPHGAGHTYAGINSENKWWLPKVFFNGANGTITEIDSTNYTDWCANAPADNVDLVTVPNYTLTIWSMRNFDLFFDELQQGGGYELYAALPPRGYSAMLEWARANAVAEPSAILTDMGITKNFTHSSYNVTFYSDPTMRYVYPNSMFVYDAESTYFAGVLGTCPLIKNWTPIPSTSSIVMAKILRYQMVCTNPISTGALHGITWD